MGPVSGLSVLLITLVSSGIATASPDKPFTWPLRPRPTVERAFDPPEQDWLPGHRGVDLAGTSGQPVYAAGPGVVVFAGDVAGRPVVSIRHEGDLRTTYEPVTAKVTVGRRVTRDTAIGVLEAGHAGCATTCLHWGVRREQSGRAKREYLDPLGLLRLSPIRLKPVHPGG
ncbi:M23 family metallopeptidase [Nocardia flavorosea]|uniref:M23 family metallopeptidase n=1 Tax=Nocardia flavorosea TaxID=53429 RepID=A0A846YPS2_9NOCA|nr:M23 family metallopeptidase [Nocardia flavorosea]NKY59590.1 M23 family metallopeptidase [Nocardia flavorosea]